MLGVLARSRPGRRQRSADGCDRRDDEAVGGGTGSRRAANVAMICHEESSWRRGLREARKKRLHVAIGRLPRADPGSGVYWIGSTMQFHVWTRARQARHHVDRLDSTAAVLVSRPHPSPQPRSQGSRGVEFIRIYVIYVKTTRQGVGSRARAQRSRPRRPRRSPRAVTSERYKSENYVEIKME